MSKAYTRVVACLGTHPVPPPDPVWCLVLFGFWDLLPCPCASARLTTVPSEFLHDFSILSILSTRILHEWHWNAISSAPRVDLEGNLGRKYGRVVR